MIAVNVKTEINQALAKLSGIRKDVLDKAISRALNKVADQAKVQASREIIDCGYKLKSATVKKSIVVRHAGQGQLEARVKASGKPIPLINYNARQKSGGVEVSVKEGRKLIKGAFIGTMPTGHVGVFQRIGGGHKKVTKNGKEYWSGLPIKQLYGPSIPAAFANQKVQSALIALVKERFPRIFEHELRFAIRK